MSIDREVQIRLDVPDSNKKIVRSCVGVKQGDKQFIVDSPRMAMPFKNMRQIKKG